MAGEAAQPWPGSQPLLPAFFFWSVNSPLPPSTLVSYLLLNGRLGGSFSPGFPTALKGVGGCIRSSSPGFVKTQWHVFQQYFLTHTQIYTHTYIPGFFWRWVGPGRTFPSQEARFIHLVDFQTIGFPPPVLAYLLLLKMNLFVITRETNASSRFQIRLIRQPFNLHRLNVAPRYAVCIISLVNIFSAVIFFKCLMCSILVLCKKFVVWANFA